MQTNPNNYITPYLPPDAAAVANGWQKSGHLVFIRAFEIRDYAKCRNCQDTHIVVIQLIDSGAFETPLPGAVYTWAELEGMRPGWYKVKDTFSYPCPECANRNNAEPKKYMDKETILARMQGLGEIKRVGGGNNETQG